MRLSDEEKNLNIMQAAIVNAIKKVASEKGVGIADAFIALTMAHATLLINMSSKLDLEVAREGLDLHKSAVLNLLSQKGFK